MTRFAFLFPGQASQKVGMGEDFYGQFRRVRELYDAAETFLGFPLKKLSFQGPLEELTKTQFTQPAIFVQSCALDLLLREKGIRPAAAAGHSLGEFSALVSAEALSFEDGLRLVKLRGELMGKAGDIRPGAMAAVIGLDAPLVEEACRQAGGIVITANYNSPGQFVISGEIEAVRRAGEIAKAKGAKIVKSLAVSGAFHSPLMEFASKELFAALDDTKFRKTKFPVFHNASAKPASSPLEIKDSLKKQLLNPVRWDESIKNMLPLADKFLEVGPGNVLTGLMKRISPDKETLTIDKLEAFQFLLP